VSARPLRELRDRLARVELVATDVDGVLTDGALHYGPDGEELKSFHVRDGMGIRLLLDAGVEVAVLSGRDSPALRRRLAELGVRHVHVGCPDKDAALRKTLAELGVDASALAVIADDVLDLPMFALGGVAVAVRDAHPRVLEAAHALTEAHGGRGALRELADAILDARAGTREAGAFHVVIPSRYAATRLPGKPLRAIAGRPMIEHVWRRGVESGARDVLVACDDERIAAAVRAAGGRALLTSPEHPSGSDRVAEVAARERWADDAIVVNLQGDEPCMPGSAVRLVAEALRQHPDAGMATLATPVLDAKELFDPNVVKLVRDERGFARWFSRAPIPWLRGVFDAGPPSRLPEGVPFLRHLGLYAYRVGVLRALCATPVHALERAESLEQLRALACGVAIACPVLEVAPSPGVDSEADLARVQSEVPKLAD
jgi:3-deoxy-manno-octulosonate cytidylyltransferase (CMP-KDO synthetase)